MFFPNIFAFFFFEFEIYIRLNIQYSVQSSLPHYPKMASSKTLIRSGVSLVTRFLNQKLLANPNPIISRGSELIAPSKFFPSLLVPQSDKTTPFSFPQHQHEVETLRKITSEGFLYPCGLPSIPFFLPQGKFQFLI